MSPFAALTFFSVLTVAGQSLAAVLLVALVANAWKPLQRWVGSHGLVLMLVVALAATLGSLYFSEIAGWTPCKLCWYQRIFMYPQVVLLAMALWRKDARIAPYVFALSLIGMAIAALHYDEQLNFALNPLDPELGKPCDATGTSCARTPSFEFGYITIPMMALTAFVLNALGSAFVMRSNRA